ncbi:MAG: response regulator [Deltaproteobacteria bacterium]|nr:response regulator [Deltaproteobacteria bacterium]MBW1934496.1 response regulator [Deltaproteobacteria bacterium]MBW1977124.1 response regulator [Deltaproteobacteria bacterium]MBW2044592.1 response regulator [Deltaproteobacteria bacterium]RLB35829.1 MAG: response regulator [Deltaproteobacteria bacterium]
MRKRIILVDDEKEFAETLAERLRTRGYDVATAFSGEQAIAKLKEYNYDVAIVDVLMPGVDGIEVLKEIKKIKPLTEVVMLTGHGTVETAIQGMKLGAYDYLMKPCEMNTLLEKLEGACKRKEDQEERIRKALAEKLSTSPMSALE